MSELKEKITYHFILGNARSGTTLLNTLLNNHPNAVTAFEGKFLMYFLHPYIRKKELSENESAFFLQSIRNLNHEPFRLMRLWNYDRVKLKKLLQESKNSSFLDHCKALFLSNHTAKGKSDVKCVVDKNPMYGLFADDLLRNIPDAKFIVLIRDYKDTIVSQQQVIRRGNKSVYYLSLLWKKYYSGLKKAMSANPDRFLVIRYEDLVRENEKNMRIIYSFLKLNPELAVSEDGRTQSEIYTETKSQLNTEQQLRFEKVHRKTIGEIDEKSIGRWETEMPARDVNVANAICSETATYYGYPGEQAKLNSGDLFRIFVNRLRLGFHLWLQKRYYRSPLWLRNFARKLKGGKD